MLVYLALVGLPLAGLFGVLRSGAALKAPLVVSGEWAVSEGDASCLGLSREVPLGVEQSGRYLRVRAGRASASATLTGDRIRAVMTPAVGPCRGKRVLLDAQVTRIESDSERAQLAGTLRAEACASCAAASFRAHRSSK